MRRSRRVVIGRNNLSKVAVRVDTEGTARSSLLGTSFVATAIVLLLVSALSNGTCGG